MLLFELFKKIFYQKEGITTESEIEQYLASAYPSNHTYTLAGQVICPKKKLKKRYHPISAWFPDPLTSIVDVGCSKGFFIFDASRLPFCQRSLGIDVHLEDIKACLFVKEKIKNVQSQFKEMRLQQLADEIETFGGPFQTVLLINTYQYLYFGSDGHPEHYLDHDAIFKDLHTICSQRIIYNNRVEYADCQGQVKRKFGFSDGQHYTREKIYRAASRYFSIQEVGTLGRYPLVIFEKK